VAFLVPLLEEPHHPEAHGDDRVDMRPTLFSDWRQRDQRPGRALDLFSPSSSGASIVASGRAEKVEDVAFVSLTMPTMFWQSHRLFI